MEILNLLLVLQDLLGALRVVLVSIWVCLLPHQQHLYQQVPEDSLLLLLQTWL